MDGSGFTGRVSIFNALEGEDIVDSDDEFLVEESDHAEEEGGMLQQRRAVLRFVEMQRTDTTLCVMTEESASSAIHQLLLEVKQMETQIVSMSLLDVEEGVADASVLVISSLHVSVVVVLRPFLARGVLPVALRQLLGNASMTKVCMRMTYLIERLERMFVGQLEPAGIVELHSQLPRSKRVDLRQQRITTFRDTVQAVLGKTIVRRPRKRFMTNYGWVDSKQERVHAEVRKWVTSSNYALLLVVLAAKTAEITQEERQRFSSQLPSAEVRTDIELRVSLAAAGQRISAVPHRNSDNVLGGGEELALWNEPEIKSSNDIFIRWHTSFGECNALLGALEVNSRDPDYKMISECWASGIRHLRAAMQRTDSLIATALQRDTGDVKQEIADQCKAIYIALQAAESHLDNVLKRLERKQDRLLARLQPQYESRDIAKASYNSMPGRDWKRNPRPKMTYAEQRKADEQALRDVSACLERVVEVKMEMEELEKRARLHHQKFADEPLPFYEPADSSSLSSSARSSRDSSRSRSSSVNGRRARGGRARRPRQVCRNFLSTNGCRFGESCRFLHDDAQ